MLASNWLFAQTTHAPLVILHAGHDRVQVIHLYI